MKKATPQENEEQLQLGYLMDIVSEGIQYNQPHCPSCKKKLLQYSHIGTVAIIEDHTFYLLCKKCINHTNELHTRRNNGRVMSDYEKYAFICQNDMTTIGWYLLKRSAFIAMDEVVPYA
jgi:hypothetical protein